MRKRIREAAVEISRNNIKTLQELVNIAKQLSEKGMSEEDSQNIVRIARQLVENNKKLQQVVDEMGRDD